MTPDKCSWFDCNDKPVIYVRAANCYFCEDHYLLNIIRFGCDLEGEMLE